MPDDDNPKSSREVEIEAIRKLLADSTSILTQVDESPTMQRLPKREYPTFDRPELKVGPLLGIGGFGIVFEVANIQLSEVRSSITSHNGQRVEYEIISGEDTKQEDNQHEEAKEESAAVAEKDLQQQQQSLDESVPIEKTNSRQSVAFANNVDAISEIFNMDTTELTDGGNHTLEDDTHYDIQDARHLMAARARRGNDARYAIKRLHNDLGELERTRGMIDMAIEAKFLSVLWHPNIVKMRGVSALPILDSNYFIVMDRLYETLEEKLKIWANGKAAARGPLFGLRSDKSALKSLMVARMTVLYDLAAAFWYMHDNQMCFRDIKLDNIGFDVRGDVKVFDFGLAKSLYPSLIHRDKSGAPSYGYNLTARTGSVPYMAPEVCNSEPYDTKCDVFSFAILIWEVLSLKLAFVGVSKRDYLQLVVKKNQRPAIKRSWPPLTQALLGDAWRREPQQRPNMKRVAALIRGDLNSLSNDPSIIDRTAHMRERSAHSVRGFRPNIQ